MSTEAYNADDVVCTFGTMLAENLGEGDDVIKVDFESPAATTRAGVGGSVVVSQMQDGRAKVTVKFLRTAPENGRMQSMLNTFKATGRFYPFLLKDTRGKELHACRKAFVEGQPSSTHGSAASDIEWVIVCPEMISNQGGY